MSSGIVFDQYQRYHFIQRVINLVAKSSDRILEVGSAGSPLRRLLPERKPVMLDLQGSPGELDIRASGFHLPFLDRTFEIVVSTDVLEHMKVSHRVPFLKEIQRVTSGILILGFPHADYKNAEADRIFFEFVRRYAGVNSEYLNEHLECGLPDANEIRQFLESSMQEVIEFKNSNVSSWLLFQLGNFTLLQHPGMDPVRSLLNNFFNQSLERISHDPPCYRTFLVCSRKNFPANLKHQLEETNHPSANSVAQESAIKTLALVSASDAALKEIKHELVVLQSKNEELKQEATILNSCIQDQHREIDALKREIRHQTLVNRNLHNYLNLFLQHPAYKLYKLFKNSFQRDRKNGHSPADDPYLIFQRACEPNEDDCKRQSAEWQNWTVKPSFDIVTAIFNPPLHIFQETINSVLHQTYGNWTWNLVDASKDDAAWKVIVELAEQDPRIKPHRLSENKGISTNMNVALQRASGDFIVVLDHDDTLAEWALFEVARAIRDRQDLDFIYSDSDKVDESGQRCEPIFKPNWSPEMMLCCNLLSQISVFRRSLLEEIGYLNPELDGAQDWDLYLRIAEKTNRIHHIPQILYHWRKTPQSTAKSKRNKPYARNAQLLAISKHLQRTGIPNPQVSFVTNHPIHKTYPMSRWDLSRDWKVSIIIPSKDRPDLLKKCLDSVVRLTSYPNYEVIVVDTGSTEEKTLQYYEELRNESKIVLVSFSELFNFGKACNLGASHARGDVLLFLNNDTKVLEGNWLQLMLQWFERSGVGVVGAKLLYPNGKIQHAGVILGFGGLAAHLFVDEYENSHGMFGSDDWYRNLSAVTGACMMIPKELFWRINGFDDTFQLNFSDVELCLRVSSLGYRVVYTPQARLSHVESATHRRQIPRVDFENATRKWKALLEHGDPYYNPNLTLTTTHPTLKLHRNESVLEINESFMKRLPEKEIIFLPEDIL